MHKKDFSSWIILKEKLDNEMGRPNIKVKEVRWCAIGHNVGSEIDGKGELFARPVVILKIVSTNTCLILPLTNSSKAGAFTFDFNFKGKDIKARLDQVRIVDLKRIKSKVGELPILKFESIKKAARDFLF